MPPYSAFPPSPMRDGPIHVLFLSSLSLSPSPLGRTDISETAVGGFVTYFALHNFSRRIEMPTRAGGIHERAGEGVFLSSFFAASFACLLSERSSQSRRAIHLRRVGEKVFPPL